MYSYMYMYFYIYVCLYLYVYMYNICINYLQGEINPLQFKRVFLIQRHLFS